MASRASARERIQGRGIPLPGDDIDTDRIIPARYLREIRFETLGRYAFQDERFDEKGVPREHPLNDPRFTGGSILLVNRNFGCGSSREHAPQSLMRMGITAFIGESFAEIFSGNCTALGLPAARVSHEDALAIMDIVRADPKTEIVLDVKDGSINVGGHRFSFAMPQSDQSSLVSGDWDTTAVLGANAEGIRATAARLPYIHGFPSEARDQ
jgi:3-isopropylmalate/(R)-2-methylmalate dehydratase small subunit